MSFSKDQGHEIVDLKPRAGSTIIARETTVKGEIGGTSPVRIEGILNGSVHALAAVDVAEGATIEGDIEGSSLRIAGTVNGNVVARELVELLVSAVVRGDLRTRALHVIEGARLEGRVQMTTEPVGAPPATPSKSR